MNIMKSGWLLLTVSAAIFAKKSDASTMANSILQIRGGTVPQADEAGSDYYEQFELDYGSADKRRVAGATRGFIKSGKLEGLSESDPFKKWLNQHLEKGSEPITGRLKPFYAADFGKRSDLNRGENPKIIIVQRKLATDQNKVLLNAPSEIDVEVRNIWQPWLKKDCDFAVRYIIPSRVNIIRILEAKKRFSHEVEIDKEDGEIKLWTKMTFKPKLVGRLRGKRNTVIWRELEAGNSDETVSKSKKSSKVNPAMIINSIKSKFSKK